MEKKIIGYKCPIDLFGGKYKMGSLFTRVTDLYYSFEDLCLPTEIVEQWEAEYEQEQYKVGEWLYFENGLLRFKGLNEDGYHATDEYYQFIGDELFEGESNYYIHPDKTTKATDQQILDVLTKVAIHKGFKEGVRFKSAWSKITSCIDEKEYKLFTNDLLNKGIIIYNNYTQKWATILPAKLELPTGYVDNGDKTITAPNKKTQHYEWYRGVNFGAGGFQEVVNYINENK